MSGQVDRGEHNSTSFLAAGIFRPFPLRLTRSRFFGHSSCVVLRESCKLQFSTNAVNALIAASFRRNRANSCNIENGFESRWGAIPFHQLLRCFLQSIRGPARKPASNIAFHYQHRLSTPLTSRKAAFHPHAQRNAFRRRDARSPARTHA